MTQRIEILSTQEDGRAKTLKQKLAKFGTDLSIHVVDVYTLEDNISEKDFLQAVQNPVTQKAIIRKEGDQIDLKAYGDFDWALEIGYLPGVTDNVGHTATELITLSNQKEYPVYSSQILLIKGGNLGESDIEDFASHLSNPLIQRHHIKKSDIFANDNGMDFIVPKVHLTNHGSDVADVNLDVSDEELEKIGKEGVENEDGSRRGPLGMSLLYMQALRDYYKDVEERNPKDIEVEAIAQTWSEHCKHTIFASPMDEIQDGIFKHYIRGATKKIREEKAKKGETDICVSVFKDDSGGVIFDDNWLVTHKVETHNSPSALDPFGGAITGIGGVNRDCIAFGKGAKPIINTYGFCVADPHSDPQYFRGKGKTNKVLPPETILRGVVHGINVGGNCSGIPTPQGFLYFDDRFAGKPLVYAGTVGLIPREIKGQPAHEKKAQPGDRIIMIGGKVGRDGIHGATFSSVALDEGSPATAVQIGDPITQKKFSDAIVKEIRDLGLYNAMTDNGAGGLSSSVGEMGEGSGGFHVDLEKVPLKYPGMAPWEIWISESQERMTLAVPPENVDQLISHLARRGVEAWDIGEFQDTERARISWHGELIMDMKMDFLHDGLPETPLTTTFTRGGEEEPDIQEPENYQEIMLDMLSRLNICSREFIGTQYDHNVQGSAVLGPLQGKGRVFADASITKPVLDNPRGVILSQGVFPSYSDIDTHEMGRAGLDFAVRAILAAGGTIDHLALLDNFCWCSSDEPERLGQLKRCAHGIYHLATSYGTPFISGKDSMFNDFKGYDENDHPVKISIPPTLLISAIGVIEDVANSISLDPKQPGDLVYLLGETKDECGASEYYAMHGKLGNNVPETKDKNNLDLYKLLSAWNMSARTASALPLGYGGLGIALAKKSIASNLGMKIDIGTDLRLDQFLFSESTGRLLVTIAPDDKQKFEDHFSNFEHITCLGEITNRPDLNINGHSIDLGAMAEAYKKPLEGF